MLTLAHQQNIVEKVLKTRAGGYVRARFLITEYQGRVQVKLLSALPLSAGEVANFSSQTSTVLALPKVVTEAVFERVLERGEVIVSTYTDLSFFVSQPTRAPSFAF